MRLNPCKVRLKQTSENLEKLKFPFGWRGPLVMIFGGVWAGGPDWGRGSGVRSAKWQGRKEMAGGRRARWQLLGVVGQGGPDGRGGMAGD